MKSLPADAVIDLLIEAKRRENDDKLFLRWCIGYQYEMSFDEFKNSLKPSIPRSTKSILKEVNEYIEMFNQSGLKKVEL